MSTMLDDQSIVVLFTSTSIYIQSFISITELDTVVDVRDTSTVVVVKDSTVATWTW